MNTSSEMPNSKFSKVEQVYEDLERFAHWLAHNNEDVDNIMMSHDEIFSELMVELVKGVQKYESLPDGQIRAVVRRMMDNRISELRYRFYKTHRVAAKLTISIDVHISAKISSGSPEALKDSFERVTATRDLLSNKSQQVFDAVIYGNDMLSTLVWLSGVRASAVGIGGTVKMRPWHVADAINLSEREVRLAYREIKHAYREVINGH
jgi:hypothetical protein